MRYTLTDPMIITSRLMPGIRVGDAVISIELASIDNGEGRARYRYHIDTPAGEIYTAEDISTPRFDGPDRGTREAAEALVSFLSAEAEAYESTMGTAEPVDGWLFNAAVAEWAYLNSDEISCAEMDLNPDA